MVNQGRFGFAQIARSTFDVCRLDQFFSPADSHASESERDFYLQHLDLYALGPDALIARFAVGTFPNLRTLNILDPTQRAALEQRVPLHDCFEVVGYWIHPQVRCTLGALAIWVRMFGFTQRTRNESLFLFGAVTPGLRRSYRAAGSPPIFEGEVEYDGKQRTVSILLAKIAGQRGRRR